MKNTALKEKRIKKTNRKLEKTEQYHGLNNQRMEKLELSNESENELEKIN